jgi:hypothetical protein
LPELKAAYEEVSQTRFLLATSPTPKTFMEQIPAIGGARARLQRVQRERFILDTQVEALAQSMLDYLSRLGHRSRVGFCGERGGLQFADQSVFGSDPVAPRHP